MQKLTKLVHKTNEDEWYQIDANGVRLGQLATKIASLMLGKDRVDAVPHQMLRRHVVVTNSDKVDLFPTRGKREFFNRHSGYPGGFKSISLADQMKKDSRVVISEAVKGMLPKNKLQAKFLTKLLVFKGAEHDHQAQQPQIVNIEHK